MSRPGDEQERERDNLRQAVRVAAAVMAMQALVARVPAAQHVERHAIAGEAVLLADALVVELGL